MKYKLFAFLTISAFVSAMAGCGGGEANVSNSNISNANTNAASNAANAVAYKTPSEEPTTNNAPTLAPVVHAYYDALKKKDDAALSKVLARDFIKSLQEDMRAENRKDMAAFLAELDKVPDKPVEVRNEKINGDKAVAEVRGGVYVAWTPLAFVREDGVWKLTDESPAIENVEGSNK